MVNWRVEILKGQESFRIKSFIQSNIWVMLPSGKENLKKVKLLIVFFQINQIKFFIKDLIFVVVEINKN